MNYLEQLKSRNLTNETKSSEAIWRYLDYSKFMSLLEYQSMFFSSAVNFTDRSEGLPYDSQTIFYMKSVLRNLNKEGKEPDFDLVPIEEENALQEFRKRFVLVNSWHKSGHESYGMWKAYISGLEGVSIQTEISTLSESCKISKDLDAILRVEHVKYGEKVEYEPSYLSYFLSKHKAYDFEKEVRAIIDLYPIFGTSSETWNHPVFRTLMRQRGLLVDVDVKKLIKKVVVSPFAEPWFYDLIRSQMKRYGLGEDLVERSGLSSSFY